MTAPSHIDSPAGGTPASTPGAFAATRWTLVVAAAKQDDTAPAMRALAELCQCYWRPLYAYVRRQGCDPTCRT